MTSCIKEDFFGLSESGAIKDIQVSNQAGKAIIDSDLHQVTIEMPPGVDISKSEIKLLVLSSFASSDKKTGDILDLTQNNTITVTSEKGTTTTWTILSKLTSAEPQLENSDFNKWYLTPAGYYEPGTDAGSTIWCTGNPGTNLLKLYATTPLELNDQNYAVRMETLYNGKLSATFGAPISAGSIITGVFNPDNLDPSNPQAAIDFGALFSGRPKSFVMKYSYKPGAENKDKNGDVLHYSDKCDIYAFLEIREGNEIKRLATAWFRSETNVETLTDIEVEFTYGELDNTFPDYMKPPNGMYVTGDSLNFMLPSHIVFVASSSFDGANFAGAVGSTLIIDDLELIY